MTRDDLLALSPRSLALLIKIAQHTLDTPETLDWVLANRQRLLIAAQIGCDALTKDASVEARRI